MTDVWLVDEDLQLITGGQASGTDYNYSDLPQDAETVVGDVFGGENVVSESFSGFLNTPTITVGTPILVDGEIIGAVLLHSPVEINKEHNRSGCQSPSDQHCGGTCFLRRSGRFSRSFFYKTPHPDEENGPAAGRRPLRRQNGRPAA